MINKRVCQIIRTRQQLKNPDKQICYINNITLCSLNKCFNCETFIKAKQHYKI